MQDTVTETEREIIDILTNHPVTEDAWAQPIHAVDKAMNWSTTRTKEFVHDLITRGLIHWVPVVAHGLAYDPKSYWKEGPLT